MLSTSIIILIRCIIQSDIKKLVAIVSVFHIIISLFLLFINRVVSIKTFYFINLRHTITRAFFFYIRGILRDFNNSRLIYLFKFIKYGLCFFILVVCLFINIGLPPFFSFISEFFTFSMVNYINYGSLFFILILLMLRRLYHLLLLNNIKTGLTIKQRLRCFMGGLTIIMGLKVN